MKNVSLIHRFVRLALAAVAVAVTATAVGAQQAATYEVVSTFSSAEGRPISVFQTRSGQFYGTGITSSQQGILFAMDATGSRTTLRTFGIGVIPTGLFEATNGSVYGTTSVFGSIVGPPGQIFTIGPDGVFTTIVASAYYRMSGVIQARDGRLYGASGADTDPFFAINGFLFRVNEDGTLSSFSGGALFDPGRLVEIDDGSLYGANTGYTATSLGTIFRLDPTTGVVTTRHSFSGPDGSRPSGRLIQGVDGLIYGTTLAGGLHGLGTVFSLDAAGTLTTLHHFSGPDGEEPRGGLIQGLDGRLYGTTSDGGAFGNGTMFVMNVTGGLTTLHDFALSDGTPNPELIQASDGAFYGVAAPFAQFGGVIFRVRVGTSTPDGFVEIVSRNSGKCLDVSGGSTDAGAPAIQWTCHGGPNQQWRLEPAGGGAVRLISRNSGQALDVSGASVDDLAPIIQWPVTGGDNQAWTLEPASDGYVRLVVRHSGKAMDVEFGSVDDGARVIQYPPHDGANQQWLLRPVASAAASIAAASDR